MEWIVPLADLDYGPEEELAVSDVLRSRWLTMGAVTQEFENRFSDLVGVKHALAVSNATVALHLAYLSLGIGSGDEVIVPSLTFVATANAVLYTGANVRFADISGPDDLNIAPDEIEKQISPNTKAIVVVHYGGHPCQMETILDVASRNGLAVIEDAAHAPGAYLKGQHLGTWGDVGCFSFFSNKNISTGEGGMLVTNRDDIAEKVRKLRSHGMTTLTWDRHQGHAFTYDVVELGYNYRIDEIHSALGLAQLQKLDRNNARREEITRRYWDELVGCGLGFPFRNNNELSTQKPAYHIFPILLPDSINRQNFIIKLRDRKVQTSIHYPPIHMFSYYRNKNGNISLPKTEYVSAHEVTLPLYPTMTDDDVSYVISAVKDALQE